MGACGKFSALHFGFPEHACPTDNRCIFALPGFGPRPEIGMPSRDRTKSPSMMPSTMLAYDSFRDTLGNPVVATQMPSRSPIFARDLQQNCCMDFGLQPVKSQSFVRPRTPRRLVVLGSVVDLAVRLSFDGSARESNDFVGALAESPSGDAQSTEKFRVRTNSPKKQVQFSRLCVQRRSIGWSLLDAAGRP